VRQDRNAAADVGTSERLSSRMTPGLARVMRYWAPPLVILALVVMPALILSGAFEELRAPAVGWYIIVPAILFGIFAAVLAHREGSRIVDVYVRGDEVTLHFMDGSTLVVDPRRVTTVRRHYLINGAYIIRFDRELRESDHVIFYPCKRIGFFWTHPAVTRLRDVLRLN